MTNREKYDAAFVAALLVDEGQLSGLAYRGVPAWDSVGQMTLVSMLEESFGIILEPDDIIDLNSYEKGFEILAKEPYGIEF